MTLRTARRTAAALGFFAVLLGAFGAHGLKTLLARKRHRGRLGNGGLLPFHPRRHAFSARPDPAAAATAVCIFPRRNRPFFRLALPAALTNLIWLGYLTPFGGLSLLAGWAALFWSAGKE